MPASSMENVSDEGIAWHAHLRRSRQRTPRNHGSGEPGMESKGDDDRESTDDDDDDDDRENIEGAMASEMSDVTKEVVSEFNLKELRGKLKRWGEDPMWKANKDIIVQRVLEVVI